jgi:uncharacterized protein (DUF1330 family)
MVAYALFDNIEVTRPEDLDRYVEGVHATVFAHGGRYLTVGGETRSVEGDARLLYPVLLEFPSMDKAQEWYDSEEYAPLKALRHGAARSTAVFFETAPSPLLDSQATA